jgi:hypothetical protein
MNATYVLGYRWLPSSRINENAMIEVVRRQPIRAMIVKPVKTQGDFGFRL